MCKYLQVAEEEGQGKRRSTARRRSSSAFMHAHMAMIPAGGRRGSVLLGSSGMGSALMAPHTSPPGLGSSIPLGFVAESKLGFRLAAADCTWPADGRRGRCCSAPPTLDQR